MNFAIGHRKTSPRTGKVLLLQLFALISIVGCSNAGNYSSDRQMAEATEIYLGDDEHFGVFLEEKSETAADLTEPSEPKTEPEKSKPKPKPKPIDVDAILTKNKAISVGLISEVSNSRIANEAKFFIPASVTKIVTTASALQRLGRDFRFRTSISFRQEGSRISDLVIVADGDPTTGSWIDHTSDGSGHLQEVAFRFRKMGVTELIGNVTLMSADPRLDHQQISEGVPLEDVRECYGAVAMAFNFRGNCISIRMSAKQGSTDSAAGQLSLVNTQIDTVAGIKNSTRLISVLDENRVLTGYKLVGTFFEKRPLVLVRQLPVTSSAVLFGQNFLRILRSSKVVVETSERSIVHAVSPAARTRVLATLANSGRSSLDFESAPLEKIVKNTNKPSDNFLADALFRAIGIRDRESSADVLTAARRSISVDVQKWITSDGRSVLKEEIELFDGNGLSTKNRMTPRALLSVLRALRREPYFKELRESLPIAGRDGTLGGRMRGTAAEGVVFAKTGTLQGAYQLAGYIQRTDSSDVNEYIPFVILTDTTEGNRSKVRSFQDIVVAKLADTVRRSQPKVSH